MNFIVMDLESTCGERDTDFKSQETIEIGAVRLNDSLETIDEFNAFVKPVGNPRLSEFCQDLTSITQQDVDYADTFDIVFEKFFHWIGSDSYSIASWGLADIDHIRIDCKRHKLKYPKLFSKKHVNVKELFAKKKRVRPCGMKQAMQMMNIPQQGTHHRAIDDARNIARIFAAISR